MAKLRSELKTYKIEKKINESWDKVPALQIDELRKTEKTDATAFAQIKYDENALYIRLVTKDSEIIANERGPLCEPSADSCLEFFFSPMLGDERYFNIEWNINKSVYLGFGKDLPTLVRLIPEQSIDELFEPEIIRRSDGFEVRFRVPAEFVQHFFPAFRLESGKVFRANCYKCGGRKEARHYLTWSPVLDTENFHVPHRFGEMTLE